MVTYIVLLVTEGEGGMLDSGKMLEVNVIKNENKNKNNTPDNASVG